MNGFLPKNGILKSFRKHFYFIFINDQLSLNQSTKVMFRPCQNDLHQILTFITSTLLLTVEIIASRDLNIMIILHARVKQEIFLCRFYSNTEKRIFRLGKTMTENLTKSREREGKSSIKICQGIL